MKDKDIIMTVRDLIRRIRSDKKEKYFKSNKEVSAFLGREASRISRYVSETDPRKITKITPKSFTDPVIGTDSVVLRGEKLTRGNRLLLFTIWATKVTKMTDGDTFLSGLMAWAGINKMDLMKLWRANGKVSGTMTFESWRQFADNRWKRCNKTLHRYTQRGDQADLFAFAAANPGPTANVSALTAPYKGVPASKEKEEAIPVENLVVTPEQFDDLLGLVASLSKKVALLRRDVDNPKPRFKRRETLCPLGFYPKSHIAAALRRVVNLRCDSVSKGLSTAAAMKLTQYYVNFCEYHERFQMTAADTDMTMLPFSKNSGLIRDDDLKPIPEKMTHQPLPHFGGSMLMCVVSGDNHFTDGGTSTAYTKYYTVAGLARALNALWSYIEYNDSQLLSVSPASGLWDGGNVKVGIDAFNLLQDAVDDRNLVEFEEKVSVTCAETAKIKRVTAVDPFGFAPQCYKWVNRSEDDDTEE